jgi:hypothetical protein
MTKAMRQQNLRQSNLLKSQQLVKKHLLLQKKKEVVLKTVNYHGLMFLDNQRTLLFPLTVFTIELTKTIKYKNSEQEIGLNSALKLLS